MDFVTSSLPHVVAIVLIFSLDVSFCLRYVLVVRLDRRFGEVR